VLCASIPAASVRNLVFDSAQSAPDEVVGARVSALVPAVNGEQLHDAHAALGGLVGFAFLAGMGAAWALYRNGLQTAAALVRSNGLVHGVHRALLRRLYFDDVYNFLLVGGTIVVAKLSQFFDTLLIDGVVNLSAEATRVVSFFTGRQLDMPVRAGDFGLVDAVVNGVAGATRTLGDVVRQPQTGRIRFYILAVAGVAGLVLFSVAFSDRWIPLLERLLTGSASPSVAMR
jgi:NADH:ubiquinone oxidoreductase subunit 5 (subunit L)/multisubunit Na+/H+ antiporter MnhA subunit